MYFGIILNMMLEITFDRFGRSDEGVWQPFYDILSIVPSDHDYYVRVDEADQGRLIKLTVGMGDNFIDVLNETSTTLPFSSTNHSRPLSTP